jgi:hypothetical protein
MNKANILKNRREVANLIRISNRKPNCLCWHSGETEEHIKRKLDICIYLKKQDIEFYTEAIFSDDMRRADVIDADNKIIFEVYESESMESLIEKRHTYPLEVRFVDAKIPFTEKLLQ